MRKYADRSNWRRVIRRGFDVVRIESPEFTGYLTRLFIAQVREPLTIAVGGRRYIVADDGYTWLQHFPDGTPYALTTMLNARGDVVEWYIDIAARTGVDERGIPWWDDLYLDIILSPGSGPILLDEDELQEALDAGAVTLEEYDRAWTEANRLLAVIRSGQMELLNLSREHLMQHFTAPSARSDGATR